MSSYQIHPPPPRPHALLPAKHSQPREIPYQIIRQTLRRYAPPLHPSIQVTNTTTLVWTPSPFTRPSAQPHTSFSLTDTAPQPYRPFRRAAKYAINMGIRPMSWDNWIELDNQYLEFHALKAQRIAERGEKCVKTDPEAYAAACELLEELVGYLLERYPSLFQKTEKGMRNLATNEEFNIVERPLQEHPMSMVARMVQDDIAIMLEGADGTYYFKAGAILLAGFWRLEDKFGMGLSEIHTSGDVPGFKDKLEKGMTNFFRRLKPESPVVRNNYFIQVDDKLAWSESIGNEDNPGIGWFTVCFTKLLSTFFWRVAN
jgi:alpha-1,2-mannosyltransferase